MQIAYFHVTGADHLEVDEKNVGDEQADDDDLSRLVQQATTEGVHECVQVQGEQRLKLGRIPLLPIQGIVGLVLYSILNFAASHQPVALETLHLFGQHHDDSGAEEVEVDVTRQVAAVQVDGETGDGGREPHPADHYGDGRPPPGGE